MQLVKIPDQILREVCDDDAFPTIHEINDAKLIMKNHNGIGISAPQVGLKKKFFICMDEVVIHPIIRNNFSKITPSLEGCLSIPGKNFVVMRSESIDVEYLTLQCGELVTRIKHIRGLESVVFQHEYDHLFGKLIDSGIEIIK